MIKAVRRISLDRNESRSMQTQLTSQLKRLIQCRELLAGERLPSTRELAGDLGISRNTAVAAYEMLLGEGYLAVWAGMPPYFPGSRLQEMHI